ncbi:orotidine-5'-phosphate decarboxylase [Candidatus Falkowbacteria bacterium CG_4_9_14_3_um_filter_36_9]|uniref:Orotidine-5'-phosphate decarboxylase n=2 Tax=Candidatus Falkowiibacteriota TaxID=1752728 RepID=A0A2M7DLH7_9BACT|nr:MAG: orotidine-5'-phosphate decarboxylase [Candidatus Falkowbacteria bacterium CG02_land_8_20_14_3_00_36_14]PIX10745.1 MAG: orotidine-5'-phosphate decarboxylase [Candidatus Falkowbacteria bacterium CG_4_8_14_3_um_filter_36_11]PJB18374.1 MAG: orotidine-5'-phosphate decarboxylase [Candidatus Falkowbacteria bacterium CG_4_9_14_3_um_filter_36_9]
MNFADKLINAIIAKRSYLCVGLDPQLRYFPPHLLQYSSRVSEPGYKASAVAIYNFNMAIINATINEAACYKPQMAFYEKYGSSGIEAFELTVKYLHSLGELVIEDAKREDGGDTADAYADGHMGEVEVVGKNGEIEMMTSPYNVDSITVTPWICDPNFSSFLRVANDHGKGFFVVDLTSFKPNSFLQNMIDQKSGMPAWQVLAKYVEQIGKPLVGVHGYSSVGVVLGATQGSNDAEIMKEIIPKAIKLIPGFGYQGGGADDAVVCFNEDGFGGIVNNSRVTNYAWHKKFKSEFQCDPKYFANAAAQEAKRAREALNMAVLKKNGFLPF